MVRRLGLGIRKGYDRMLSRKLEDTDAGERYRANSWDLKSQSRQGLYRIEWGRTG